MKTRQAVERSEARMPRGSLAQIRRASSGKQRSGFQPLVPSSGSPNITGDLEPGTTQSGSSSTPPQMARYSRRRRYTRPYSVSFRFNRARRSFRKQSAGAMQQRDSGRFIVKTNTTGALSINEVGAEWAVGAWNVRQLIGENPMFVRMAQCFDQFKINAIRVKIIPVGTQTPAGSYVQSVVAWDRNVVDVDELSFDVIASYGSAKLNYFATGTKTSITHFIAAETISEKSCYIQTEVPEDVNVSVWRPILLLAIKSPVPVVQGVSYNLNYAMEWSFDLTFRGTRYA